MAFALCTESSSRSSWLVFGWCRWSPLVDGAELLDLALPSFLFEGAEAVEPCFRLLQGDNGGVATPVLRIRTVLQVGFRSGDARGGGAEQLGGDFGVGES